MVKFFFMPKNLSRLLTSRAVVRLRNAFLLLGVFAALGASSAFAADIMRVSACGYKSGEEIGIRPFSELPGLSVSPTDTVIVYSNSLNQASMQAVFTVTVPFGYRLSHWVKTFDDPNFSRTFGEKVAWSEGRTELTVRYETGGQWMYLAPVIVVDNNRKVTIAKSPFGEGTVGTNLEVYASQKGDVFKLAAVEKRDEKTGFAHSTFRRWENGSTDYERDAVVDSNDTFCAEFVPNSWTVTFDANGGEVFPTSKVVTCDATYGWLPTPTLTGSEFRGWKISQSSGVFVNKETKVGALGPHTLQAQWEKLRFSIEGKVSERCQDRGIVNGSGEYAYGSFAYLTAIADEGSQFERWTDGLTDSTRRILVVSNATYTAEFDVRQCDVVFNYRGSKGQLLSVTRHVLYGDEAQPPSKEEYDSWAEHKFTSWDKDDWQKVTGNHIVTALYDMETFDVRFAYRGLDGNSVTTMPQHVETGKAATPPDDKVINNWRGMSFKGWDLDFSVVRSDLLVTALYETKRYAIAFSYNNGEREVSEQIVLSHGETIPLEVYTAKANHWSGHDFKGWLLNGHEVKPGDVATESGTIAAVYEGYAKIVFAPGKGGGEMKPLVFTNFSGKVTLPPNAFTNEGYVFAQWVDASGEKHYDDGDEVSVVNGETQTLTAEWTPIEYFVAYDGNGGTIYGEDPGLTSASYDESFQLLNLFVDRPGHDFLGWCLDRQGKGKVFEREAWVKNLTNEAVTVVLYAQWQEKNEFSVVVYWPNGGTGEKEAISYSSGKSATFESNDYTRVGYSPDGWANTAAGAKEYNDGAAIPDEFLKAGTTTDVYAVWSPIHYTLKFDANGGEGAPEEIGCTYDRSVTIPEQKPTMTGYNFQYWAKEPTGDSSGQYQPGGTCSNLTDVANEIVTLYARWDAQPPCKIVYHTNDGTGNATTQVVAIAEASSAQFAAAPSREGYEFVGWTNVNSTVVYEAESSIPVECVVAGETADFFASWIKEDSPLKVALGLGGTDVEVTADAGWSASQDCVMCETLQSKLTLKFTSAGMVTVSATIDNSYYFLAYQLGQGEEQYSTDNTLNLEQHVDKGSSLMLWQNNDNPDTMKVSASWTPDQQ